MRRRSNRLEKGGRIDRTRPVRFRFDGRDFEGLSGDTLASALLANDVSLVARSFKYHRPRGIVALGAEEPNALVQCGIGNGTTPNQRATRIELTDGLIAASQNRWPLLRADIGAINSLFAPLLPAGFYYKTFMWPPGWWLRYEHWIRRVAGLGKAPPGPDPDHYRQVHAHCDVLVVGAGPAGLAAAAAAGRSGARVILADEQPEPGGSLLVEDDVEIDGRPAADWLPALIADLQAMPELTVLTRTTVSGLHDHGFLTMLQHRAPHEGSGRPRCILWKVRARHVILATGAHERPLVFADNDRPGIMLASAVRGYITRYGVTPGRRVAVFCSNDDAYRTALVLVRHGVEVPAIVDVRSNPAGPLVDAARAAGLTVHTGHAVTGTSGWHRLRSIAIRQLSGDGQGFTGRRRTIRCDALAVSGGWTPAVHLFSQGGGSLAWDEALGAFLPDTTLQQATPVGGCAGTMSVAGCLNEGHAAGGAAARAAGHEEIEAPLPRVLEHSQSLPDHMWTVPHVRPGRPLATHFVDFQNDVTAADVHLAAREGYTSVEHLKRYTTTGMGTDQGKTSNINALAIMGEVLGSDIPGVGHTTFRPPYTPAAIGAYAGRTIGALFDPVRTTAMDPWHRAHGATFEHVGQWMRAWYYPRPGESMRQAVDREVTAAREAVGLLDASTLGKIDIQGPDAAEFLNRVYTNSWLRLQPGRARYGLMLGEDGMVMDDGVTTRLAENHFHMTTTTGGAGTVLDWLEEWLQTEWPDLDVRLTSVTEHWAVAALCGPRSRELLGGLCADVDLSAEAFPFMSMREGTVAGIPARIFRISFSGEVSFEINVRRRHGLALWEALVAAGEPLGLCPYGTEAMHVLRAEKGFIIVGQETDGTVTPFDLGMDWIVSKAKTDFIGKRGLGRRDLLSPDRKQLVGLLSEDPRDVIPEGAQVVETVRSRPPMTMIGHVTSSYHSPTCGRAIALALVKGGRSMLGSTVSIPLENRVVGAVVSEPRFFDPEGERMHG